VPTPPALPVEQISRLADAVSYPLGRTPPVRTIQPSGVASISGDCVGGLVAFVFMVLHYPAPDRAHALALEMAGMRAWMEAQAGCLGVEPPLLSEDGSVLVGFSRWESKQALLDTGVRLGAPGDIPEGELRPRQRYFLSDRLEGTT
jgi:hypothetical protein